METAIRPLTIDEMYFKKLVKLHLSAETISGSTNSDFLQTSHQLTSIAPMPNKPPVDLSGKVFSERSFMETASKFIKKNWVWVLLGSTVIITGIVIRETNKKRKRQNQFL